MSTEDGPGDKKLAMTKGVVSYQLSVISDQSSVVSKGLGLHW